MRIWRLISAAVIQRIFYLPFRPYLLDFLHLHIRLRQHVFKCSSFGTLLRVFLIGIGGIIITLPMNQQLVTVFDPTN